MLSRQQLEIINKTTLRYPLHIAEKDYFLALVLQLISNSSLKDDLVFKGGTALHHCYLEQFRFSEDLDFSSGQRPVTLDDVAGVLTSEAYLEIKKHYQSDATIKIERLRYTGPLGHPNSIKVEIDFLQNVLLPAQEIPYRNVWGLDFTVRVMDIREICAEKIRAMSDRARYRDFYDLFLLLNTYRLDVQEVIGYLRQKEIRRPIRKTNILENWKIANSQKKAEIKAIYIFRTVEDQQIADLIHNLPIDEAA
ncbi:MAG: nucleotidyl transferase AbiEii/AbiGii toxin family protein [Chloroflexota bacterium]